MSEAAAPLAETRRGRTAVLVGLALLMASHAALLRAYFAPALGSPDANCYHVSARLLAHTGELSQRADDPLAYVGGLWLVAPDGAYYPKYPPFYPAIAAAAEVLFGHPAGLYVNPVAAWLAVLLTFVAARAFLPGWAALLAAACVAAGPVFDAMAVDQIAHAPSVALTTASFAAFLHAARGRWSPAAFGLSGLLLGLAVGVRYTNLLLVLPALAWFAREPREHRRRILAWGLGVSIPCAVLAWYHWRAFGSPLRTAYALTDEQSAFSLGHLGRNARLYVPALFGTSMGPMLALSLVGFALLVKRSPRRALFYAAWTLPLALLYCAYYYAPEHHPLSFVRFLQPLQLPAVLLACTALVELTRGPLGARWASAGVLVFVLVQGSWSLPRALRQLELRYSFNDMLSRRVAFAREAIPAGSTVFATRWLLDDLEYHLDPERREEERHLYSNDLVDQAWLTRIVGRFIERPSIQQERVRSVRGLLVDVPPEDYRREVRARIDGALAEDRAVFVVGAPNVQSSFEANFGPDYELEPVASLPALEPRHRLMTLRRKADLTTNPAWGEMSIVRVRALP